MKAPRLVTVQAVRYVWEYKLAAGGKCVLFGLLAAGALGSTSVEIPVYQLFCALTALLLVTIAVGYASRPKVSIVGQMPAKATASQPVTGEYTITNRRRRSLYEVGLGFFQLPRSLRNLDRDRVLGSLSAGASATLPVTLLPARRGVYELPELRAFTSFPFNLFRSGVNRIPGESLLVLPEFHPVAGIDVPVGSRHQPGGISLTSNVGESPEYIGNRDFVPGDSVRRIDFRSWARLCRPVVKEYQQEYYCRIALVLDTFIPAGRRAGARGFAELEAAVSLSAAVADALTRGEYIIDIFAAGPELYVFRAGRHTAHFENVLEILACVDACRHNPFEVVAPALADELGNISTVICVLLDWDESRRQLVRTAQEAGCDLKVLIVRAQPTTLALDGSDVIDVTQYSPEVIRNGGIEQL